MVVVHTVMAAAAAQRSLLSERMRRAVPFIVGTFLAAWFGVALVIGDGANFSLRRNDGRLIISLLVGFGPVLVVTLCLFASKTLRMLYAATPPAWLVQTNRIAGFMFLYPFLYYGVVLAGFAAPAAIGDFLRSFAAVGMPFSGRRSFHTRG